MTFLVMCGNAPECPLWVVSSHSRPILGIHRLNGTDKLITKPVRTPGRMLFKVL
jgi:hypothetical protein